MIIINYHQFIKSLEKVEPFIVVSYIIHIKPKNWSSYNSKAFLKIFITKFSNF